MEKGFKKSLHIFLPLKDQKLRFRVFVFQLLNLGALISVEIPGIFQELPGHHSQAAEIFFIVEEPLQHSKVTGEAGKVEVDQYIGLLKSEFKG
jgi:hypothetical protein